MGKGSRREIVIIEDDEALVKLLKATLTNAGYDVRTVRCGTTALSSISDVPPRLVILDLGLPDMDGYEVCRKLRESFHSWVLPIVMLTGMDKPADQLRGFAHGADAYLTKPCDPPELLNTIHLLLEGPEAVSPPAN